MAPSRQTPSRPRPSPPPEPSFYSCAHCGAQFASLQALGGHKSVHSNNRRKSSLVDAAPSAKRQQKQGALAGLPAREQDKTPATSGLPQSPPSPLPPIDGAGVGLPWTPTWPTWEYAQYCGGGAFPSQTLLMLSPNQWGSPGVSCPFLDARGLPGSSSAAGGWAWGALPPDDCLQTGVAPGGCQASGALARGMSASSTVVDDLSWAMMRSTSGHTDQGSSPGGSPGEGAPFLGEGHRQQQQHHRVPHCQSGLAWAKVMLEEAAMKLHRLRDHRGGMQWPGRAGVIGGLGVTREDAATGTMESGLARNGQPAPHFSVSCLDAFDSCPDMAALSPIASPQGMLGRSGHGGASSSTLDLESQGLPCSPCGKEPSGYSKAMALVDRKAREATCPASCPDLCRAAELALVSSVTEPVHREKQVPLDLFPESPAMPNTLDLSLHL